jgi:hypothetical protein
MPFSEGIVRSRFEDIEILDFEINIDLGIGSGLVGDRQFL